MKFAFLKKILIFLGQKITFFEKVFGAFRDYLKSWVKLLRKFWSLPSPKVFDYAHVCFHCSTKYVFVCYRCKLVGGHDRAALAHRRLRGRGLPLLVQRPDHAGGVPGSDPGDDCLHGAGGLEGGKLRKVLRYLVRGMLRLWGENTIKLYSETENEGEN